MGLTGSSVGINAVDLGFDIKKQSEDDCIIALAGNPNVGKSTLFNNLTGLHQHTGNWPGKTVTNAQGYCKSKNHSYVTVDIPGTYSLMAHSAEEEVARNFICFGKPDATVVVCDATCLERNLNLVLQTMEISQNVIVCVNLLDEAKHKNIKINLKELSKRLNVPVVGTVARSKKSKSDLLKALDELIDSKQFPSTFAVRYHPLIEQAISIIEPSVRAKIGDKLSSRWLALRLLDCDDSLLLQINDFLGEDILSDDAVTSAVQSAQDLFLQQGISKEKLRDMIVSGLILTAEEICLDAVTFDKSVYNATDRKIDKFLTGRLTGYPVMILLLALVFWITISGANFISDALSSVLFYIQDRLSDLFNYLKAPGWLHGVVVLGIYRVLAWVVSVMLPPMAIFFPLFTLLEDLGYLPRIAYNLDKPFKKCSACGKQALTMCMGFGCNAAGVIGCRIIDSPRERLLAIITNNFVPCNGRFPMLISLIAMFLIGTSKSTGASILSAVLLTAVILLGIGMTLLSTKMLSKTLLKGLPSAFTLELPPYRRPQIGRVIVRSIFDRTLFVLGRAVTVAAPAGCVIWLLANITVNDVSLLNLSAEFLNPFASLLGLDGVILIAFILGFPANEIVIPIIIMAYMAQGSLVELSNLGEIRELFIAHGWTWITAVSTMLFSLFHWPCSTTLITVKKETGSVKWTLVSFLLPTVIGVIVCFAFSSLAKLIV